jgi:membrane-anchored glycerophosphoryl diester phosphodiesterase (GDPDase)
MHSYNIIMLGMAVMAVIVFVALFFFKAGYGYLSTSNWGPKISNKTAWVLMEAPAFIFLLYYSVRFALNGAETGNSKRYSARVIHRDPLYSSTGKTGISSAVTP